MINRKVFIRLSDPKRRVGDRAGGAKAVSMVFTLYNAGASYQAISDALNRQGIPVLPGSAALEQDKVKRLLENPVTPVRRIPILVEADIFQAAQKKMAEKNARKQSHGEKPRHCAS